MSQDLGVELYLVDHPCAGADGIGLEVAVGVKDLVGDELGGVEAALPHVVGVGGLQFEDDGVVIGSGDVHAIEVAAIAGLLSDVIVGVPEDIRGGELASVDRGDVLPEDIVAQLHGPGLCILGFPGLCEATLQYGVLVEAAALLHKAIEDLALAGAGSAGAGGVEVGELAGGPGEDAAAGGRSVSAPVLFAGLAAKLCLLFSLLGELLNGLLLHL